MYTINYQPLPTLAKLHKDQSLVKAVMGPIGSGKTTGCCYELMNLILNHPQDPVSGLRRSLCLIIRNSYSQLQDTTLRCWLNLFPSQTFGHFSRSQLIHHIRLADVHCDVLFRALDSEDDIKKLLSLEATFIFVNEAREINFSIIQMLPRRLRFPSPANYPAYYRTMLMDSNPPDTDHWWYKLFEEQKPAGWKLFKQPGGLSPHAENLKNLPAGYYTTQMAGATKDWLRIYRDGQYGFSSHKTPVYSQYNDQVHCQNIDTIPNWPLVIGLDFGLTPAAVICQRDVHGNWLILDELTTWDTAAVEFARLLQDKLAQQYPNFSYQCFGDPAGQQRSQTDGRTIYDLLAVEGLKASPAPSNSNFWRKEVFKKILSRLYKGKPAFLLHPRCKILRKALLGGYHYKNFAQQQIAKDKFSHPIEALEYAFLGVGEDLALVKQQTADWQQSSWSIDSQWPIY